MEIGNHERLFEKKLCSINHDVRSAMLLSDALGTGDTASQIRKNLLEFIGYEEFPQDIEDDEKIAYLRAIRGVDGLLPQDSSFIDYCRLLETQGFAEGTVLEHPMTRTKQATYWEITPDGERYAQPAAALGIRASNFFGVSMFYTIGKTGAPPKSQSRAAYNTGRILRTLYNKDGEMSERELVETFQMFPSDVKNHCDRLSELRFVKRTVKNIGGGRKAFDALTDLGKGFFEEFLLPIWIACGDSDYMRGEYRNTLTKYLQDVSRMRYEIKNALILLHQSKK